MVSIEFRSDLGSFREVLKGFRPSQCGSIRFKDFGSISYFKENFGKLQRFQRDFLGLQGGLK